MAIDKQQFRKVMGRFAAGVTVVTTVAEDGTPSGLTATAFTSVSLQPPLVLVCIDKNAESLASVRRSGVFAVNFLRAAQEAVSQRFAVSGGDKFAGVSTRSGVTGAPLLADSLGYVECRTTDVHDAGDHFIFVGQVEAADAGEGEPLVYFNGAYRELTGR
jgi:flavin reductase (DIM6/NTAB) family NADH-FMN oxidoreductase RutF